jgi:Ca2+-binding RTX toxin-like protein
LFWEGEEGKQGRRADTLLSSTPPKKERREGFEKERSAGGDEVGGVGALALALFAGAAMAVTITGTPGNDSLRGTDDPDTLDGLGGMDDIFGYGGNDKIYGRAGYDLLTGDGGADRVWGGLGNDVISLQDDGEPDVVDCGAGRDKVYFGTEVDLDTLHNCERVI